MKRIFGSVILGLVLLAAGTWWWLLPEYRLKQAAAALEARDIDQAEALISALAATSPNSVRVQLLISRLMRYKGNWQEAQNALFTAKSLGLGEAAVKRELLLINARLYFREAEPTLRRELEQNPDDVEILQALAQGYARQKKLHEGDAMFARWEKLAPHHTELYFQRALMYKNESLFYQAVKDFHAYLRFHPDNYTAHLFLADSLLGDARMTEAAVELEKCRKIHPDDPDPIIGLANCVFDSKPDEARELLAQALRLQPKSVKALLDMAKWDMQFQKFDDAISQLEKVLTIEADSMQAHVRLGQCYRRKGDVARASLHEERYKALDEQEVARSKAAVARGMR